MDPSQHCRKVARFDDALVEDLPDRGVGRAQPGSERMFSRPQLLDVGLLPGDDVRYLLSRGGEGGGGFLAGFLPAMRSPRLCLRAYGVACGDCDLKYLG